MERPRTALADRLPRRDPRRPASVTGLVHRVLFVLHVRGFHPAVLAGLIMMPTVVAVGFWTDGQRRPAALPGLSDLRGTLIDETTPGFAGRTRNEASPTALPSH